MKSRHFQPSFTADDCVINEVKGPYNEQAFLDDAFTIPLGFDAFFYDGKRWYYALSSPFYLDDVLHFNRIGVLKKHKKISPVRLFLSPQQMTFLDRWALDYVQKKKLGITSFDWLGSYKFVISLPNVFLKSLITLGFALGDIPYIQLVSKLNLYIQQDLIAHFRGQASVEPSAIQRIDFETKIRQRFEKWGLTLSEFQLQVNAEKR